MIDKSLWKNISCASKSGDTTYYNLLDSRLSIGSSSRRDNALWNHWTFWVVPTSILTGIYFDKPNNPITERHEARAREPMFRPDMTAPILQKVYESQNAIFPQLACFGAASNGQIKPNVCMRHSCYRYLNKNVCVYIFDTKGVNIYFPFALLIECFPNTCNLKTCILHIQYWRWHGGILPWMVSTDRKIKP